AKQDEMLSMGKDLVSNVLLVLKEDELQESVKSAGGKIYGNENLTKLITQIAMPQIEGLKSENGEPLLESNKVKPVVEDFTDFGLKILSGSLVSNEHFVKLLEVSVSSSNNFDKVKNIIKTGSVLIKQPHLQDTIHTLPSLIDKHADGLAHIAEGVLEKTDLGKKLSVNINDALKVAKKKLPVLIDVAEAYEEKKYFQFFKNVAKIILSPSVIKFSAETVLNTAVKYVGNKINRFMAKKIWDSAKGYKKITQQGPKTHSSLKGKNRETKKGSNLIR
ncbi:MAG: hypothetical protein DGJ47_001038, partial [Rickettsiaceae bacterium]